MTAEGKAVPTVFRKRRSKSIELFRTTPPQTVCPNFWVLRHANGCAFAPQCSYCYLKQSFRHLRAQQVFTNVAEMVRQVRRWIRRERMESFMLNSGNLSDSLAFEAARPLMKRLIEVFRTDAEARGRPHSLLIVTKGGMKECRALLESEPCRNVIVSFSINNPAAARRYESGAATVADRLRAARTLRQRGWRVRLRIDPMIAGFDYGALARRVRALRPERVTLGTLRAEPGLESFVEAALLAGLEPRTEARAMERYPTALRLTLYRRAIRMIGRRTCEFGLCEETPEVWEALGLDTEAKRCNCGA